MTAKKYAIIVAGGSGTRMKSDLPKQFLLLNHKPILAHTINQFLACDCEVIVVLPSIHFETFKTQVLHHCDSQEMLLTEGGKTRFESVKNGLNLVSENSLIAIHDAVRPLISTETILRNFELAAQKGSAICAVDLKDSIRKIENNSSKSVNRNEYKIIQTPQTFRADLLLKAYQQPFDESFTDDASVFEKAGFDIHLIEGEYKNIKITTPEDLQIAEALL
jgi:2-C-methyl-D-erythritol 4-phosphate cytidylyltransferase